MNKCNCSIIWEYVFAESSLFWVLYFFLLILQYQVFSVLWMFIFTFIFNVDDQSNQSSYKSYATNLPPRLERQKSLENNVFFQPSAGAASTSKSRPENSQPATTFKPPQSVGRGRNCLQICNLYPPVIPIQSEIIIEWTNTCIWCLFKLSSTGK